MTTRPNHILQNTELAPRRKSSRLVKNSSALAPSQTPGPGTLNDTQTSSSPVVPSSHPAPDHKAPCKKRKRISTGTAKHLPNLGDLLPLTDIIRPDLLLLFIGLNPGISTSLTQHCYAHPSNHFYKLLHSSGLTTRRHTPVEDVTFPETYNYGFTNIIPRPTKDGSSLKREEYAEGAHVLEGKVARNKPLAVCCVGKGVWDGIYRTRHGQGLDKDGFRYGWQNDRMGICDDWEGAWVFVAASTSGLSASLRPHEKEAIWRPLGDWVEQQREQKTTADLKDSKKQRAVWAGRQQVMLT
ncbi:MAG: hypothetical protein M1828_002966 [Chrysothrix sp. TS-e1954]|nr:MAG: hypothetical protein M1828_002966 [Chrysothrix sp. TS-e1954]